jgi:hypothetical protein
MNGGRAEALPDQIYGGFTEGFDRADQGRGEPALRSASDEWVRWELPG